MRTQEGGWGGEWAGGSRNGGVGKIKEKGPPKMEEGLGIQKDMYRGLCEHFYLQTV